MPVHECDVCVIGGGITAAMLVERLTELKPGLRITVVEAGRSIFDRANRAVKQIAEAEKFDVILQEAVYASPRIDITDKVIKALADSK